MTVVYPVVFTKTGDKKDTYLVYIPDIDSVTEGYGLKDAVYMARDLIGCKLFDTPDAEVPPARDISKVNPLEHDFHEAGSSFVSLVDLDLEAYRRSINKKTVRRNVSIPEWLNKAADDAHINVSRVLKEALMSKLGIAQ